MFVLGCTIHVLLVQKEFAGLICRLMHEVRAISGLFASGALRSQQVFARFAFAAGRNQVRNRKDDHGSAFLFFTGRALEKR